MSQFNPRRSAARLATVLCAVTLLVACSSQQPAAPKAAEPAKTVAPAQSPPPTQPTAPAKAPEPTLVFETYSGSQPWTVSYGMGSAIMVTTKKEIMNKHGFKDIKVNNLAFAQAPTAVHSGAAPLYYSSGVASIATALKPGVKSNVRFVGGLAVKPVYQLLSQPSLTTIESLKSKNGGVPGIATAAGEMVRLVLLAKGMKFPGDYNLVITGNSGERLAALQSKAIDFEADLAPAVYVAIDQGFKVLADAKDYLPSYATGMIVINDAFGKSNRATIVNYLKAHIEANMWLKNPANKDEAIKMIADNWKIANKPLGATYAARLYKDMIEDARIAFDLYTPKASIEGNIAAIKLGQDMDSAVLNQLWDMFDWSYLKEALTDLKLPVPSEIK